MTDRKYCIAMHLRTTHYSELCPRTQKNIERVIVSTWKDSCVAMERGGGREREKTGQSVKEHGVNTHEDSTIFILEKNYLVNLAKGSFSNEIQDMVVGHRRLLLSGGTEKEEASLSIYIYY